MEVFFLIVLFVFVTLFFVGFSQITELKLKNDRIFKKLDKVDKKIKKEAEKYLKKEGRGPS